MFFLAVVTSDATCARTIENRNKGKHFLNEAQGRCERWRNSFQICSALSGSLLSLSGTSRFCPRFLLFFSFRFSADFWSVYDVSAIWFAPRSVQEARTGSRKKKLKPKKVRGAPRQVGRELKNFSTFCLTLETRGFFLGRDFWGGGGRGRSLQSKRDWSPNATVAGFPEPRPSIGGTTKVLEGESGPFFGC